MGRSHVTFTNSTRAKMYVAYMRLDYDCQEEQIDGSLTDPWRVLGWINLDPGETETRDNPTNNKYFYYYAEDANGAIWSGPYIGEVDRERFNKCRCLHIAQMYDGHYLGNPFHDAGFRELDTDMYSGVNFINP